MIPDAGPLLFALLLGVILASGAAWLVAGLYRRRMVALMRSAPAPDDTHATSAQNVSMPSSSTPTRQPPTLDRNANLAAVRRYLFATSTLCVLIGITQSALALLFVYDDRGLTLNRLLVLGLVYAWPMVMAWGLLLRWSWLRVVGGVAVYMTVMAAVVMLTSDANQTLAGVAGWLVGVVAIPIIVALLMGASDRIRAVAPYLLPVFVLLAAASVYALEVLALALEHEPDWLFTLTNTIGAYATLLLFALAPWLLLAWPIYALTRRVAHAYRNKRFSDQGYLFAAYWSVILTSSALPALQAVGLVGLTQFLPWLWIPLGARVLQRWLAPSGNPPTLLVLRVFQQDAQVGLLFDRVVERWRLSGNTVLIAGTDLVSRTLDPDDLFTFINGRLDERFIANTSQLATRIREFDRAADPDGRYRVNECYCFDTTWQAALAALVREADVVLMDLRGFQPHNQGCRHELGVLAHATHLQRVVLLHDATTAREVAEADIAGGRSDRFAWVETPQLSGAASGRVLTALFNGQHAVGRRLPAIG